ncbi:hypothetical protein [Methanofollis fontis]|uniref:hypothetical protein n=1 Tax=Methanofollis fontis TaxID=2052832 RepID=UPI001F20C0B8|nr:hypothetical protein [Methanofollis fontis]
MECRYSPLYRLSSPASSASGAAHRLPAKELRYVFIAVMVSMGLKMMGVFSLLGLPL